MINPNALNAPLKTLTAAVLLSALTACGSDNDNNSVEPLPPQGNVAPVATADTADATVGSQVTIDVLANDSDPDGDTLTLERVELVEGSGKASIEDNKLLFEPDQAGEAKLTYVVSDGQGGKAESTVTISVTENVAPIATADTADATVGSQVTIDVLANDSDPDGDPLTLTRVDLVVGNGKASIEDNKLLFAPEKAGEAKLAYEISDGRGGEARSTVTVTIAAEPVEQLSYVGSQACLSCHTDKQSYLETGHNFKLTKVDGEEPIYPFSSVSGAVDLLEVNNSLGNPGGWQDISYVVGGYHKIAMFIDQNGYFMTGDKAATRVAPKGEQVTPDMVFPSSPNDAPDSHGFDYCGRCHTTGWRDYTDAVGDDRNTNRQDDMPGMGGTFALTSIQCEACHGAGSAHIQSPSKLNIVKNAEPRATDDYLAEDMGFGLAIACSECHTTDDALKRYPDYVSPNDAVFGGDTQGGRLKVMTGFGPEGRRDGRGGRHAATTLIGIDPDTGEAMGKKKGFACSTCHDPHKSKYNEDQPGHEGAMVRQCTDCHTKEFNNVPGSEMAAIAHGSMAKCIDCHMPSESHLFKIDLDGAKDDPRHFSADGDYMKPWLRAYDSCSGCHQEDYDERATRIGKIHQ